MLTVEKKTYIISGGRREILRSHFIGIVMVNVVFFHKLSLSGNFKLSMLKNDIS
jgi:hypothetical protein